jgi:hypothetical protein
MTTHSFREGWHQVGGQGVRQLNRSQRVIHTAKAWVVGTL